MFGSFACRSLMAALLCIATVYSFAQNTRPDSTRSIKERVALFSAEVAAADSSQDPVAAANARMDLASLVKPPQALRLHQEVLAMADDAPLPPQVVLRAHRGLVELYTGMHEMTKANREWAEVLRLTEDVLRREATDALEKEDLALELAGKRTDNVLEALRTQQAAAQAEQALLAADYERRSTIAMIAIVGGFFALLLSALLFGRYIKRARTELKELRQEVTWLRMVTKKGTVPEAVAPVIITPVAPSEPQVVEAPVIFSPPPVAQEDAVLLDLVRRRSQERINTLRDARARGDLDKVVRVVHSLKPQLVSIDPDRFAGLCSRLISPAAPENSVQWNADLDAFEAGIQRTLER